METLFDPVSQFNEEREKMNEELLADANIVIKRFFSLDGQTYREGALSAKSKELLGLVSSLVLRCDDCVKYHLGRCRDEGVSTEELMEALSVGLVVGGSIVIPHLRRASVYWNALKGVCAPKKELFRSLFAELERTVNGEGDAASKMAAICSICSRSVPWYNWFGFYLTSATEEGILELGPYVGEPTDHVRIPFGRGICGQAAERLETFLVDDVSQEGNYLSCSINVKSEIVVPIIKNGTVAGEIDIDSHKTAAFDNEDKEFLESLAKIIGEKIL